MIHNIHGAPHHPHVRVGDIKRLVSSVWKTVDSEVSFYNWFHPDSATIESGPAEIRASVDTNGAATVDVEFTGVGTVVVAVNISGQAEPKRLTIEVGS